MAKPTFGDLSQQFQQFQDASQLASSSRLNQPLPDYQLGNDNGLSRQFGQEYQLAPNQVRLPSLGQSSQVNPDVFGNLNAYANLQTQPDLASYWPSQVQPVISSGSDWASEFIQSNRVTPTTQTRFNPNWAQEYNQSIVSQPQGQFQPILPSMTPAKAVKSVLDQTLTSADVAALQYYLDPQVKELITSGQAGTAVNLFLSNNPKIETLAPSTLKLLKAMLLDSLMEYLGSDPALLPAITQASTSSQLYQAVRGYRELLDNSDLFGQVLAVDLHQELDKYHQQNGVATDLIQAELFPEFSYYEQLWRTPQADDTMLKIWDDFKLKSQQQFDDPLATNSLRQQVVKYYLGGGTRTLPILNDPRRDSLVALSRNATDPEIRTIAANLVAILPRATNNRIYADLISIGQALQQEPLEVVRQFLNRRGLYLGQKDTPRTDVQNRANPTELFNSTQLQELRYYLKPEVQQLIQSGQAQFIADDFITDRIANPAALPAGSLELIKFLLYDLILSRANDYQSDRFDLSNGLNSISQDNDLADLLHTYGNLIEIGLYSSQADLAAAFMAPLQIDMELVYRRYRHGEQLPGDDYLVPYFQKYVAANGQPNTLTDELDFTDPNLDPIERQMLYYFNVVYPNQRGNPVSHNDRTRTILRGLVSPKNPVSVETRDAVNKILTALPQNTTSQVYQYLLQLADQLRVGKITGSEVIDLLNNLTTTAKSTVDLTKFLPNYSLQGLKLLADPEVLEAINSHSADQLNELVQYRVDRGFNFKVLPDLADLTKLKLIKLAIITGLDISQDYNRKYQDQIVSEIMAAADLYTLKQLAQYYITPDNKTFQSSNLTGLVSRLERLKTPGNTTLNTLVDKLLTLAKTKAISAVVGILETIAALLKREPNQADAIAKFLADKGVNLAAVSTSSAAASKPTLMPLAAPIQTNYANVLASRQFLKQYSDFLTQPNKSKAKFLLSKLNDMQNLVLVEALSVLPGYDQLNQRLGEINKVYLSQNKSEL